MHYSCIPVRGLQKQVAWILNLLAFFCLQKNNLLVFLFFCFASIVYITYSTW